MYLTITSLNRLAERALFETQGFQEQKFKTIRKSRKLVSSYRYLNITRFGQLKNEKSYSSTSPNKSKKTVVTYLSRKS